MAIKKKLIGIIILITVILQSNYVYAEGVFGGREKNIWEQAQGWLTLGRDKRDQEVVDGDAGIAGQLWQRLQGRHDDSDYSGWEEIAGILLGVGIFIIVIVGAILGIRFMTSNPEKQAEVKNAFVIYFIGSIIIIGGLTIWKLLIKVLDAGYLYN